MVKIIFFVFVCEKDTEFFIETYMLNEKREVNCKLLGSALNPLIKVNKNIFGREENCQNL